MGQNGEKLEPSNTAGRNENGTATLENRLEILGNIKNRVTIWFSNFIHGIVYLREMETCPQKNLLINVHSSSNHNCPKVQTWYHVING